MAKSGVEAAPEDVDGNRAPAESTRVPDPRWLDARESAAWRTYLRAHHVLNARLGRELQRRSDLSHADYGVLVMLSESPDHRCRPFELAEGLQWEKSRLSHHLKRMQARGLVERTECPSDARGSLIAITAQGMEAITAAAPCHVADVRRLFVDVLDEGQLDALIGINEAILDAVASDPT